MREYNSKSSNWIQSSSSWNQSSSSSSWMLRNST